MSREWLCCRLAGRHLNISIVLCTSVAVVCCGAGSRQPLCHLPCVLKWLRSDRYEDADVHWMAGNTYLTANLPASVGVCAWGEELLNACIHMYVLVSPLSQYNTQLLRVAPRPGRIPGYLGHTIGRVLAV
jgi:hypothetical protein